MTHPAIELAGHITGWMSEDELIWLYDQARLHRLIIEVGTWKGRSTAALCAGSQDRLLRLGSLSQVITIDHFLGSDYERESQYFKDVKPAELFAEAQKNLKFWLFQGLLFIYPANFVDAIRALAPMLAVRKPDMVFLDDCHRLQNVQDSIQLARSLLQPGGLLCGHDHSPNWPGVKQAVDTLLPQRKLGPGSIWYCTL